MRFLHTSDWHIGRNMGGHTRREEQEAFLTWFVGLAAERRVDAVVIAGDVYDRTVPSEDSVRLLNRVLVDLRQVCPVVLIPGNHDQAVRLGFVAELLEDVNVHIRYLREHSLRAVSITGEDGVTVRFYGLPYLDPDNEREALAAERSHESVLTKAMDLIRADVVAGEGRAVVVAHAFIRGGTASDSERDVRVGGVGDAPVSVFDGVDYVALGHLHGAQTVSGKQSATLAAYSGSPLGYSFSEESHIKSVTLVEMPEVGPATIERIPTPIAYPLVTLRGTLDELQSDPALDVHRDSWVRIRYTDERAVPNAFGLAQRRFSRLVDFSHAPDVAADSVQTSVAEVDAVDPVDVLTGFFSFATGSEPRPSEIELLREVYERVLHRGDAR